MKREYLRQLASVACATVGGANISDYVLAGHGVNLIIGLFGIGVALIPWGASR